MVIIPLLLMLFAFAMERIESSLLHSDASNDTDVKLAKNAVSADSDSQEHEVHEASAA